MPVPPSVRDTPGPPPPLTARPQDPNFILIKREVSTAEQEAMWSHTRTIRTVHHHHHRDEKVVLQLKQDKHRSSDDNYEFVRRRRRSKSPGLLVWMAGGRPS